MLKLKIAKRKIKLDTVSAESDYESSSDSDSGEYSISTNDEVVQDDDQDHQGTPKRVQTRQDSRFRQTGSHGDLYIFRYSLFSFVLFLRRGKCRVPRLDFD